ncbi:hypothetical protein BDA96_01G306500 [Sorghum bicolor]|uniref:WRKY domain-containing protein n=2 Tax=Sorghum bicolor TaxID=4558 RepID=A0A921S183_SORBI|nr:hypothetical protein BDA96_01G306500 [Sorghum bicolor]
MCDFFWLSPADQAGDLSDVVRASLQPPPPPPHHHRLPPPEEEEGLLLLQARVNFDGDDHDEARSQQLVHGNGSMRLMLGSNGSGGCACDHAAALCPQHHPEAERLIPQPPMSGPQPQLCAASSFVVERDDDDAPVLEEHVLDMATAPHPHPHTSAIKRRKSQTKKVVCIPAPVAAPPPGVGGRPSTSGEVVPSDLWAWRKYGQKPIKGSPYPRGYYRCSSSKGCSARKQVERSRTDPSMLVITYTSDHNHPWPTQRNALAGSTRPAFSSSSAARSHHHHHHHHHSAAAVPDTTPAHRHASNVAVADNATPGWSIISASVHHQLLKQEVVDVDNHPISKQPAQDAAADRDCLDMFADMDGALDVLCASNFHPKKQQQQVTAAQHLEKLPEEEDEHLLLGPDPFSFSFLDWVGASFGVGETAADNGDHS